MKDGDEDRRKKVKMEYQYLLNGTSYEAPLYAVFFSLPPLRPPNVQIFSSAHSSGIPTIYLLSLLYVCVIFSHPYKTADYMVFISTFNIEVAVG
jgi:hypothetical protein